MSRTKSICLSSILVFLNLLRSVCAEFYTALAAMEPLQESHRRILNSVNYYIYREELRIDVLRRHLSHYEQEQKVMEDFEEHLLNPINSYKLVKRLTTDLSFFEEQVSKRTVTCIFPIVITLAAYQVPKNTIYPTVEDFEGAAHAVGRVHNAYGLNVTQLAEGVLSAKYSHDNAAYIETFTPFSTSDCYELSQKLYSYGDYKGGVQWMLTAFHLYKPEERHSNRISKTRIIKFIVYGYHHMGDDENIIGWINMLSEMEQNKDKSVQYAILGHRYEQALAKKQADKAKRSPNKLNKLEKLMKTTEKQFRHYRSLCRGQTSVVAEVANRLKCRYLTETHPFLRLAPIKLEQLHNKPDLVLLHDMMSESEIEDLKKVAKPNLLRDTIKTVDKNGTRLAITKKAFIPYNANAAVNTVTQRVVDVTGLNMDSAEDLMVANYGIGGHYSPHYDFANLSYYGKRKLPKKGDRLASLLFYMSDVTQGGATVFLHLGVTVFPVKGAALLWRNLLASGEADHATRHAACPVLRGDKWVAMKWIHEAGQELLAPCSLEY